MEIHVYIILDETTNIFDEEYSININNSNFNIENNIFGYSLNGIRIISSLSESNLGFYLLNNAQRKIESNETLSLNDRITFKVVNDLCVQKKEYSIIYENIISEPSYSDLLNFADSVEYYPSSNNDLEQYYTSNIFYGKKAFLNFSINYCYKTCRTCSCYGNNINHHCLSCSDEYPYFYK